jgi:hypothetical protein
MSIDSDEPREAHIHFGLEGRPPGATLLPVVLEQPG